VNSAALTLINGQPQELWSVRDRGLQYGDGLFETIACLAGRPRWFDRHLGRLALGCERLGLPSPEGAVLRAELQRCLGAAPRALAKIILTRGVATARGYRPSGDEPPTRIISAHEWPLGKDAEFRVGLSRVTLGTNPLLAGLKHLNRLEQVLAQREAAAAGLHEVLMCTGPGEVITGSMSNLFVCRDDEWLTAPVTQCGVAGVMRALVLELAPGMGLKVRVAPLAVRDLAAATSLFVTNVRLGLQPVHWYQGRKLAVDERGVRLQRLIDDAGE
jgi:4-amino-4-deoxychorismate lyase